MLRVLVIDENELDFLTTANLLETEFPDRVKVVHAANLIDAMVLVENRPFHVILQDIATKPGGGAAIRRIAKIAHGTPIIALANGQSMRYKGNAVDSGAVWAVEKTEMVTKKIGDAIIRAVRHGRIS